MPAGGVRAGRRAAPAEGGLRAVHPPRAAGRRAGHRRLELPAPDRRQRDRAGAALGERGAGQARPADAALRRPLRRRLRAHRGARRPRRGGDARPRGDRGAHPLGAGGLRLVHRLGRGRPRGLRPGRPPLHRRGPGARREGPRVRLRGRRLRLRGGERGRRRLLQRGAELLRHRACLRGPAALRPLRRRRRGARPSVSDGRSGGPRHHARAPRPPEGRRPGRAARGGGPRGRGPCPDRGRSLAGPRLLLRAGRPDRRRPRDEGDVGRDLRARGRDHAGARRRRGRAAHERQPLRSDRVGVDPGHGPARPA